MVLKLISATPSPYARKVRIQLLEKNIKYDLQQEVPWDHTTETPNHNPLEKLPILFSEDDEEEKSKYFSNGPVYESAYILEYVEEKFEPRGSLTPQNLDDRLYAKRLEVLADGVCDAGVLAFFEKKRGEEKISQDWLDRQNRKVEGGVKAISEAISHIKGGSEFLVGAKLSIADLAVVSMYDFLKLNEHPVLKKYEVLQKYADKLNERESFEKTKPKMFEIKDEVV